jgi:hypothetical protein
MGVKNSESGNSLKKDNFQKLDASGSLNLRKKNPWNPTFKNPFIQTFGEIHSNEVDWHSVINLTKFYM